MCFSPQLPNLFSQVLLSVASFQPELAAGRAVSVQNDRSLCQPAGLVLCLLPLPHSFPQAPAVAFHLPQQFLATLTAASALLCLQ